MRELGNPESDTLWWNFAFDQVPEKVVQDSHCVKLATRLSSLK
jgi:hypothetical protein